jgi:hypothetical protein
MNEQASFLTRAIGLAPFAAGIAVLALAHRWSSAGITRSWLSHLLLVVLLAAPLIWPLSSIVITGKVGIGRVGAMFESRFAYRRMKRGTAYIYQGMTADNYPANVSDTSAELQTWLIHRIEGRLSATMLGDVLAAAEQSWRRYNYISPVMMPRLLEILPDRIERQLRRDRRITAAWAASAVGAALVVPAAVTLAFPYREWTTLAIDVVIAVYATVVAQKSYKRSVLAALSYATRLDSAIDLYRFKLLEHLHLRLPHDTGVEAAGASGVSELLRQGWRAMPESESVPFEHPTEDTSAATARMAEIVDRDVPNAISASIEKALAGPQLTWFEGTVGAHVNASNDIGHWELTVAIGMKGLPIEVQLSEPLVVPGIPAAETFFIVVPESDTLSIVPPRAELRIVGEQGCRTSFDLALLSDAAEHTVWLNILQDTELVQVLAIAVTGRAKTT